MDGKGRCMDNIFVERLWRSLKYEEVYLNAYATVAEARTGIGTWLSFYNEERQHQSLGYRTPRQLSGLLPARHPRSTSVCGINPPLAGLSPARGAHRGPRLYCLSGLLPARHAGAAPARTSAGPCDLTCRG
jgi:hypothetical protein